jgi:16S rRNA G966 N2-methylase RsmD
MARNQILKEILSDSEIMEKYNIKNNELDSLTTNPPYHKKIVEVLSVIINENDNHLNSSMIYKKLKNVHNI